MPISGPSSYLPTTSEFLDHWQDANTALGAAGPLIIRKETLQVAADVTRAMLDALFTQLVAQHATVQAALMDEDLSRNALEDAKTQAIVKLGMFNEEVRALLGTTMWARSLTVTPKITSGQGPFTDPLTGALQLWTRINGDNVLGSGVELDLRDGTDVIAFEEVIGNVTAAFRSLTRAERTVKIEREARNDLQDAIYPILKQYRVVVGARFAPESAVAESLPRLSPEDGHTPEPVNASIVWVPAETKARIEWEASTDPALEKYQVRYSPGTEYHEDAEDIIATFQPEDARVFLTNHALTQPGALALFKVFVVLTTGNESGSTVLAIMRPE